MSKYGVRVKASGLLTGAAFLLLTTGSAWAQAQEPAISGSPWIAYGIIGALIAGIVIFVLATIGISRSDEAYERGHHRHNEVGGIPMLGDKEDDKDE